MPFVMFVPGMSEGAEGDGGDLARGGDAAGKKSALNGALAIYRAGGTLFG